MGTLNTVEEFLIKVAGLYTSKNIKTIQKSNLHDCFYVILRKFSRWSLLTQATLDAAITITKDCKHSGDLLFIESMANHPHPIELAYVLHKLKEFNLLIKEYIGLVVTHQRPRELTDALNNLKKFNLLTKKYIDLVVTHQRPRELSYAFSNFHCSNLLTQKYIDLVVTHQRPRELAYAFINLRWSKSNLLTKEYIDLVVTHQRPRELSITLNNLSWSNPNFIELTGALHTLKEFNLLTKAYIGLVVTHQRPRELTDALNNLKKFDLLTKERIDLVVTHQRPRELTDALNKFFDEFSSFNKFFDKLGWKVDEAFTDIIGYFDLNQLSAAMASFSGGTTQDMDALNISDNTPTINDNPLEGLPEIGHLKP